LPLAAERHVVPAGAPATGWHPAGTGPEPLSQRPSPSKEKVSDPGVEIGIEEIGEEESFLTPMSASSEPSYGP